MSITEAFFRPAPGVVLSPGDDGYVAYDTSTDRLYHLNPSAALLVELCDGGRTIGSLEQALRSIVGADGWRSYVEWLYTAIRDGLLVSEAADGPVAAPDAGELVSRARALRSRGQVLAAFICQQRAAELAPDEADCWHALGELAHIVGRRDEARRAYERYSLAHPEDAEVEHLLVSLRDAAPPARTPDRAIDQLYARFASFYDESMCDDLGYCAPQRLAEAVAPALAGRGSLRILDLGCGTGLSGHRFRPLARRLVGLDLSPAMIERARRRDVYDALHTAEITSWLETADPEPCDLIIACDSLIYFGDLTQVVVPAARRLAPGGVMALTVERGDTPPFRLTDSGRYTHHPEHVAEVAARAGLSVISLDETVVRYEYGEPVHALVAVFASRGRTRGAEAPGLRVYTPRP